MPFQTVALASNDGAAKAASYTQTIPAGTAAGEFLLLCTANCAPDTYTTPTGYGLLKDLQNATLGDVDGAAFSKTAVASEASFTVSAPSTLTNIGGALLRYDSIAGVRDSQAVAASAAATTSPAPPALTGVLSTDIVVHFYAYGDNVSQNANVKDALPAAPSGWTQRAGLQIATNVAAQFTCNLLVVEKLGGTDLPTVTAGRAGGWTVISIALIPAFVPFRRTRSPNFRR